MRFALIGKPLGHSLSPQIHALISQVTGIACTYELQLLEPEQVRPFIKGLRMNGFDGMNATIPYKLSAHESVDTLSPEARAIGAVNTVELQPEGSLAGHNTDYHGFGAMLTDAGIAVSERRCAILGSGGSARAVAAYLMDTGASDVLLASRDKADAARRFPGLKAVSYDELGHYHGGLLVNCTPVGMHPNPDDCPVAESMIGQFESVADLIYNPRETLMLARAKRMGCTTADGLMMLVAQAVRAREIWHRVPMGPSVEREVYLRLDRAMRGQP